MEDLQARFFAFVDKLEDKLKEFGEASIAELTELNANDSDEFKREYFRMRSAVQGQFDSIVTKGREVLDEKVLNARYPDNDSYYAIRNACYDRLTRLENLAAAYRQRSEDTHQEDLEAQYRYILDEHERIKDSFRCSQCGGPISVDRIYFTTTYLSCPACSTRNTFEPSSRAKMLEHLGRSLAEQRTKHLLKAYEDHGGRSPELYRSYMRAMFDEWNSINPAMTEEHEKFFLRMMNDHDRYHT